jgi:hypothetical protein
MNPPAPDEGFVCENCNLGYRTQKRAHTTNWPKRICCASSAHRISTHDSSLRVRSRAHSFEPRRNSLERGEIVTAPRGVPNVTRPSNRMRGNVAAPRPRSELPARRANVVEERARPSSLEDRTIGPPICPPHELHAVLAITIPCRNLFASTAKWNKKRANGALKGGVRQFVLTVCRFGLTNG